MGPGNEQTLNVLGRGLPMERLEFATGQRVLDWTVPSEWVLDRATLSDEAGNILIDSNESVLNVVNYSRPFKGWVDRVELEKHLFSNPETPDATPYVTSYYGENWGLCISKERRDTLVDDKYFVDIATSFKPGNVSVGQVYLPGETDEEILFSSYVCHPQMINDEIAAPVALSILARELAAKTSRRYSYRFVFLPETIGALCLLDRIGQTLIEKCIAGFAVANVARDEPLRAKRSRRGDSLADRAIEQLMAEAGTLSRLNEFAPLGSDERQYCSPGFNLPVCAVTRSVADFPEYHTSADDMTSASLKGVSDTVNEFMKLCSVIENNHVYRSLSPYGEPNLGKRDLYPKFGGANHRENKVTGLLWLLNLADGSNDLLHIAKRSGVEFALLSELAAECEAKGLLECL